ncbi:MAG TPA: ABC transporter permease subunit [Planctomycetota bacterium]|nr:ABC transporter permease subunit [Planctomycetota bacterium]
MNLDLLQPGPLVVKELGGMSRRGWTYLVRTFYVVLAAVIVYVVAMPALQGTRMIHTSEYAELSRRLFHSFTSLQMFFLPLAAAISASDMLHSEARRGTLSILLLTPLRPGGIVWGKWKAVMLYIGSLAFSGLPVLGIAVYLGGVGVLDLLWSLSLSLALSGAAAAMAICYSVRDRTVVEAAIRAYLMLQFSAIPYAIGAGLLAISIGEVSLLIVSFLHPYFAWYAASNPTRLGGVGFVGWIGAVIVTLLFCRRYLKVATRQLVITRQGSKFLDGPAMGGPARNEESHEIVRAPPIWEQHPLLWKECATRTVRLPPAARTILLILFALLTLVAIANKPDGAVVQLWLLCPIALLLAVAVGAGHFAREKERRGFEMLLSAPIHEARVVGAKLVSGLMGLEVGALVVMIAVGFGTRWEDRATRTALMTVPLFIFFTYLLSSWLSLRSNSYRTAFLSSAGVVIFILIGIPMLAGLFRGTPVSESPAFEVFCHLVHPLWPVFSDKGPVQGSSLLWGYLLLYGTTCAFLIGNMILRFRRLAVGS